MRKTLVVTVMISCLAAFAGAGRLSAELPASEQAALWSDFKEAKNKSGAGKLEAWDVIEGIPVIKRTDNVSRKAAALATVIQSDNGEKYIVGDDRVGEALTKKAEKKGLKERDRVKLKEQFDKHNALLVREFEEAKKGREKFLTRGVDFSRMIEKYLAGSHGNTAKAASAFAAKRAYTAEITAKEKPTFADIVESITSKKPLILLQAGTENAVVCVGFLRKNGTQYLVTADPEKIDFEEVPNADLVRGEGEMARKLREAAKDFDQRFGPAKLDRKVRLSGAIPPGVEITRWKQGEYSSISIDFVVTDQSVDGTFSSGTGGLLQ